MVAQCVNPSCCAPLHSFSEGRLFQFEVVSISVAASDDMTQAFDEKPQRQTSHFWLCGQCASSMTLVLEARRGLRIVPVSEQGEMPDLGDLSALKEKHAESHNC